MFPMRAPRRCLTRYFEPSFFKLVALSSSLTPALDFFIGQSAITSSSLVPAKDLDHS